MDGKQFTPAVCWKTNIRDVVKLSSSLYRVTVKPLDINEPGALNTIQTGYYLQDTLGNRYSITAVSGYNITVSDDFQLGYGPRMGRVGTVFQSVALGDSPFLSPARYENLDESARAKAYAIDLDILWKDRYQYWRLTEDTINYFNNYGYLYNWYAAADSRNIASSGWRLPVNADIETLATYIGGRTTGATKLRTTGTSHWTASAYVGTDNFGFSAKGAGFRQESVPKNDFWINQYTSFWLSGEYSSTRGYAFSMDNVSAILYGGTVNPHHTHKNRGGSIRLIKESTSLTHGQIGSYTGNDGYTYDTICIGTQEWLSVNLIEKKYRDGSDIPEVTDYIAWAVLPTGARASYLNDETNAFTTTITDGVRAYNKDLVKFTDTETIKWTVNEISSTEKEITATVETGASGLGTENFIPKWLTDGISLGDSPLYTLDGKVGLGLTVMDHMLDIAGVEGDDHPLRVRGSSGGGLIFGAMDGYSSWGAMWSNDVTPSSSNYAVAASQYGTEINMPASASFIRFNIGGIEKLGMAASGGMWVGSGYSSNDPGSGKLIVENGLGVKVTNPTAYLHLGAGTSAISALKLTTGTLLSATQDGAFEYGSSHIYFTIGSTRYQLDQQVGGGSMVYPSAGLALSTGSSWATSLVPTGNSLKVLRVNVSGTDFEWYTLPSSTSLSLTTTGTSGAATLISGVLNIPNYANGISLSNIYGDSPIDYNNTTGHISHSVADGFKHVAATSTTNNGKILTAGATAGTFGWSDPLFKSITTTGTSGAATLVSGVLNIPNYATGSGIALTNLSMTNIGTSGNATYDNTTGVFNIPNYTYTLPIATDSILGGVKIGTGLTINATTGVLSANPAALSLTTTGSGAATLISGVLNIPTPAAQTFTSLTTTGTNGAATLTSGVLNIPNYSGGISLTDIYGDSPISYNNTTGHISIISGVLGQMLFNDGTGWVKSTAWNTGSPGKLYYNQSQSVLKLDTLLINGTSFETRFYGGTTDSQLYGLSLLRSANAVTRTGTPEVRNVNLRRPDIAGVGLEPDGITPSQNGYQLVIGRSPFKSDIVIGDGTYNYGDSYCPGDESLNNGLSNPYIRFTNYTSGTMLTDNNGLISALPHGSLGSFLMSNGASGVPSWETISMSAGGNHKYIKASGELTGTGVEQDMSGSTITFTPTSNFIYISFASQISATAFTQPVTFYINIQGSNVETIAETVHADSNITSFHHLAEVTPYTEITVKVRWNATNSIHSFYRNLSILDLGSGGGSIEYSLPTMSSSVKGGAKVGQFLEVTGDSIGLKYSGTSFYDGSIAYVDTTNSQIKTDSNIFFYKQADSALCVPTVVSTSLLANELILNTHTEVLQGAIGPMLGTMYASDNYLYRLTSSGVWKRIPFQSYT